MNRRVQKPQKSQSQPKLKTEKIVREVGPRREEIIQTIRKKNEYVDNFSYHETKDLKRNNPRYFVVVEHNRKGDIFGGNFEQTSYERQVYSQGGNRPKLNDGNLRGKKQPPQSGSTQVTKKTTTTTTKTTTRERKQNPVSATATKEKIHETTMKRRNEGTVSKTESRTETKTTTSGVRGGERKTQQTTTTTTRTKGGDAEGSSIRKRFGKQ